MTEALTGRPMQVTYNDTNRVGDHIWWISDVRKFQAHYPEWGYCYDIKAIIEDIVAGLSGRMAKAAE